MDIKDVEIGKEYIRINNNGFSRKVKCLAKNEFNVKILQYDVYGFGGESVDLINKIECERYLFEINSGDATNY
jgi:site-specific DNA-adenine methylase